MPQAVRCRPVSGGLGSIAGQSTWDLRGTGFLRVLQHSSVSVIQPVLCAHSVLRLSGQECEVETKRCCSGYQAGTRVLEEKVLRHCSSAPRRLEHKCTDFEHCSRTPRRLEQKCTDFEQTHP